MWLETARLAKSEDERPLPDCFRGQVCMGKHLFVLWMQCVELKLARTITIVHFC